VVVDGGLNCHGLSRESGCSAVEIGGTSSREPRRRHPRVCGEETKEAIKKLGFWRKAWEREREREREGVELKCWSDSGEYNNRGDFKFDQESE